MPDLHPLARGAAGLALALAVLAGISALAHFPLGEASTDAALRVSLRTAHARVEICRERSAEELAALPAHMRQLRICEETAVDYRLEVAVDGRPRVNRRIAHRGLRRTRPLVVEELVLVPPGEHRVEVRFVPVDPPPGATALPRPSFDAAVILRAGRVRLLVLGEDGVLRLARAGGGREHEDSGRGSRRGHTHGRLASRPTPGHSTLGSGDGAPPGSALEIVDRHRHALRALGDPHRSLRRVAILARQVARLGTLLGDQDAPVG